MSDRIVTMTISYDLDAPEIGKLHIRAPKGAKPFQVIRRGMIVLRAERDALRNCPAHQDEPYDLADGLDDAAVDLVRHLNARVAELTAALADTRERLEKERDAGFNHGYLMAVANIINLHRETVVATDVLLQIDLTIDDAENFELAEYDMEALNRLCAEPRAADFFKSQRRAGDAQEANR